MTFLLLLNVILVYTEANLFFISHTQDIPSIHPQQPRYSKLYSKQFGNLPAWKGLISWGNLICHLWKIFFKEFIYLFLESRKGRETNIDMQEKEKHQSVAYHMLQLGIWLLVGHMPWPGIKLVTFWFRGRHPTHQATPVRTGIHLLVSNKR